MRSVWLIVAGGIVFLASLVLVYGIRRNAFYQCAALPGPDRAYPNEGGPAGFDVTQFPVAGVNCWWNSMDGGIITTFHPDVTLSVFTYGALALVLAGVAGVTVAIIKRVRATNTKH